jgi:prolyl oligopeptidase
LIENKYASTKTLAIYGRSNGGLLTGAAITQRPELFGAAYVGVPLLDMIRYHLFKIARYWIPEYGSSENKEQFEYILKYSPYHNVKEGTNYPATILVTAASDSRVDANHAMKMTAALHHANNSEEPIILYVERQAGHGVGKPLDKLAISETDYYAFLGWKTGLKL